MAEFKKQWLSANLKLGASPLILTLPDKTSMSQAQFTGLHTTLLTQQDTLQTWAVDVQIARGNVNVKKVELLAKFNLFTALMDGSYQGTGFYEARPLAPGITFGKELFLKPLGDAMKCGSA